MPVSVMTTKGQTTIPKKIRDYLKLVPGDKVDFVVENDGRVLFEPTTSDVAELEGILHRKGMKSVSLSQMKKTIKKRFEGK